MSILSDDLRDDVQALGQAGWQHLDQERSLSKSYAFANFRAAFAWMTEIAIYAEKINHHPDWSNCYGQVRVVLSTHDVHQLTEKDIKLAKAMDRAAQKHLSS